jgi:HEAT repeat protein
MRKISLAATEMKSSLLVGLALAVITFALSQPSGSASGQQPGASSAATGNANSDQQGVAGIAPAENGTAANQPAVTILNDSSDDGWLPSIFSGAGALGCGLLGFATLLFVRRRQSKKAEALSSRMPDAISSRKTGKQKGAPVSSSRSASASAPAYDQRSDLRLPLPALAAPFGEDLVDQEVSELIRGQAHRMDVLSSRAPEDRQAIEASLIKVVNSANADEAARRRASEALEGYGFVARQSAALLVAPDAFERKSAARLLGDIKSAKALPFLLEALHDPESMVRNEAVASIGQLQVPMAIGALLDMARKHPDVPDALVSRALSACSFEGLSFLDPMIPEPALPAAGNNGHAMHEITGLKPISEVEELPESCDDPSLQEALTGLRSVEIGERSKAVKVLARYHVQSSVAALAATARHDEEASVRALAVSMLASINHESVFSVILIAMADDSREVRAAAARSLSRLSFDRADAYVRVIETSDAGTLRSVAQACINAGIVSQEIDRLASSDRRQAYEAFSLVSLLAEANMNEPIVEAIAHHPRTEVRLAAVHLLGTTDDPAVFRQLQQLAADEQMPEAVRAALLKAVNPALPESEDGLVTAQSTDGRH